MNATPQRSLAIDVMRGLTLCLMIIVNMSISEDKSYAPLLHANWHGLTLTDVVFPSFLFVVGTALSFTLERYQSLGPTTVLQKIFKRTFLIFLCGYLLYWFPFFGTDQTSHLALLPLENTRILGVLQRIALCYCFAALLLNYCQEKTVKAFCVLTLLLSWWLITAYGDLTLGGNAALKLDRLVLGESHMYRGEGVPFDPEGLLGTLPSMVHVLVGFFAGRLIRAKGASYEAMAKLLLWGALAVLIALTWSSVLPFNKKLWTSSYALCTIGIDLVLLGALVYFVDLLPMRRGTYFFEVFGKNTLFIYLFAEVLMSIGWLVQVGDLALFFWIYNSCFQWWAGDKNGSLVFAVVFMLGCWMLGYAMDKRKIYIKL